MVPVSENAPGPTVLSAARPGWRTLTEEGDERTDVLSVAGGWLYRTRTFKVSWNGNGDPVHEDAAVALAFQPERAE